MRWGSERRRLGGAVATAGAAALLLGLGGAARADGPRASTAPVDTSYGRVDGDLTAVVGAGAVLAPRGLRAEGELRLRYLESAGVFASYEDGPLVGSPAEPGRVLATGIELRPLFFFRWLQGHETGRAHLDLTLDSIGLELGAFFSQPQGRGFGAQSGLQAGLGLEVPLFADPTGPWIGLHGGVRWSDDALASGVVRSADDRAAYLAVTLAWHQLLSAHLVDPGDRRPR